ncbi:NAD(P)/FAD-dependent oxidoreductase [Epilithonimonas arachidiradicis]|uniref:NADH:ubiquinone reductase (non-electrogenic) n=1 Tax=Epilithonimonas arachidiradicis TaxID=1617282 RepID=A0A420D950_9FLAO|nr:NAD(P)/FAD-dependent oxidoreductase [Epilithonimonas arachidiradicis]RKE87176.1 NADH dehydrogenase [Epilithonimonas arachidiradicis]GGG58882.1 NADH dehydrogenase [Epilithonimonas arachidiradicis]
MENHDNIVIIGGGFAGVELAEQLLKSNIKSQIILVDKNNYNFFPPLIYQVATGFLDVSNISYPFRKHFRSHPNFSFVMGELQEIVPAENKIILNCGEIFYSKLIIATGTVTNYFGNESIRKNALPMKTITDAINLKNKILERLEKASKTSDDELRAKLTTFVIAGGGPTGVEVAGMLSELRKNILFKDYPELESVAFDIYLIDGLPTILAPMSKKSQHYAQKSLEKSGVIIKLGQVVKDYVDGVVHLADGTAIASENLIWTAGVTSQAFQGLPEESFGKGKRLRVDSFNKVIGTPNIYAVGDTCLMTTDPAFPQGHPQLAQVAIQQAKLLAKNIIAKENGKDQKPFIYNDKGSMAIIKRNRAVADLPEPFKHFNGFVAWLIWIFVHLMSLINVRNKVTTFFNWLNSYTTKDQPLRMIIDPSKK